MLLLLRPRVAEKLFKTAKLAGAGPAADCFTRVHACRVMDGNLESCRLLQERGVTLLWCCN